MFISLSQYKPIEVSNDYMMNKQQAFSTTPAPFQDTSQFPQNVFAISYMYYSLFGTCITVFVGMVVSLFTQSEADAYDSKFIHPMVYRIAKWFPGSSKLFSNEHSEPDIKNSSLKEPREQHFNSGFDIKSEELSTEAFKENEINNSVKFKSNIIYKSDLEKHRVENYKKLSEDGQFH